LCFHVRQLRLPGKRDGFTKLLIDVDRLSPEDAGSTERASPGEMTQSFMAGAPGGLRNGNGLPGCADGLVELTEHEREVSSAVPELRKELGALRRSSAQGFCGALELVQDLALGLSPAQVVVECLQVQQQRVALDQVRVRRQCQGPAEVVNRLIIGILRRGLLTSAAQVVNRAIGVASLFPVVGQEPQPLTDAIGVALLNGLGDAVVERAALAAGRRSRLPG